MFHAIAAHMRSAAHTPGQWLSWVAKACLAAGAVYALSMLTLGLPGAIFVELVMGLGRNVPPDGAWPMAIEISMVGSLLIVPASLAVRLVRPGLAGWGHTLATAAVAFLATSLFTLYASSDRSPAQQGPESLTGFVVFDIAPAAPSIAVGSGPHRFRLNFIAGGGAGGVLLSGSAEIDGMVPHRGAQSGQPIRFDPQYSIRTFVGLYPGDHAVIRNTSGYFMQLKIVSARSKGHEGATRDAVVFEYQINEGKWPGFTAL
jgi:hypothetical protein